MSYNGRWQLGAGDTARAGPSRPGEGRGGGREWRAPSSRSNNAVESGRWGALICEHELGGQGRCAWRTDSALSLQLHRADRHLIYPTGGKEELYRIDPLLEEERKEAQRRARKRGPDDEAEQRANSLIVGLNINLDTPELVQRWLSERRKRWPTRAVVEQKALSSWDQPAKAARVTQAQTRNDAIEAPPASSSPESSSSPSQPDAAGENGNVEEELRGGVESDSSSSSGSDVDEERDAVSSKAPPSGVRSLEENKRFCRFFQKGTCRNGAACSHLHEIDTRPPSASLNKKKRRPRAASPNPFEAPHLLRALLHNEIASHMNYVAQVIRFLVRNDYLHDYETEPGQADEQARRRSRIAEVGEGEIATVSDEPRDDVQAPLHPGALPVTGNSLYQPHSPLLKPLESLSLPPEPDEFALMDPLRANDARSLTHEQFRHVARDGGIRSLLLDDTLPAIASDRRSKSLIRALSTFDALPTYNHRSSALEQILGVSQQSAIHAHQLGPTFVRSDRQAGGPSSGRLIGEQELFRLGLRVGPMEIVRIRQLAARISSLLGGSCFEEEPNMSADPMKPWYDAEQRQAARIKQWHREGEWRDEMRKLGVEVD